MQDVFKSQRSVVYNELFIDMIGCTGGKIRVKWPCHFRHFWPFDTPMNEKKCEGIQSFWTSKRVNCDCGGEFESQSVPLVPSLDIGSTSRTVRRSKASGSKRTSMQNVANKINKINGPRPLRASSAPLEARWQRSRNTSSTYKASLSSLKLWEGALCCRISSSS